MHRLAFEDGCEESQAEKGGGARLLRPANRVSQGYIGSIDVHVVHVGDAAKDSEGEIRLLEVSLNLSFPVMMIEPGVRRSRGARRTQQSEEQLRCH